MFELVLHHRYDDPQPHDLSGNGNFGYGAPHRVSGSRPGRQAARFDGSADRIFVTPSPTLTRPGDIRADLTVKLDAFGHRRTLIEGYLSFAFGVEGDGALSGSVYRALQWTGIQSTPGLVPLDTWITVTFVYTKDGALMLSMNGATVAESYAELGEASGLAWPFGLNIGAWPDGDQRLWQGCIEEVMLWRSMPEPRALRLSAVAQMARYAAMRYKRAVEKLRILAGTCERVKMFWSDTEPFLKAVYAFGEVLDGAGPLDAVQVAVAINLPPEEVRHVIAPWCIAGSPPHVRRARSVCLVRKGADNAAASIRRQGAWWASSGAQYASWPLVSP